MNISVDKAGDLKIGRKKCRLYKKDEVVKVAKKYGINTEKKTVKQLCGAIKDRTKNNVPRSAKKMTPSRKAAINKKIVTSFMKSMVTTNATIKKLRELNENTPKSTKNIRNVRTMNNKEIKAQLRKMQPLIKKLASQLGTKKMQLTKKQKRLKEMKKEVKRFKPYTKITMEVRELATQEYAKQMGIQAPWRFTAAYELERVGYIIRDAPAFYKRWMDKTNPKIQKARTEMEMQIRILENEIPVLETEIPELKDKVTALRAKYTNMKEAVTVPKPPPKPRPKLTKKQLEELKWRRHHREMARLR